MPESKNPLEQMMPSVDNPEYHRRKAEHDKKIAEKSEAEALKHFPHMANRVEPFRRGAAPPKGNAPMPSSINVQNPHPDLGLQVEQTPEPESQPVQAPITPPPTARVAQTPVDLRSHPMLMKLREDFGIDAIPTEDVTIKGHTFTMRPVESYSIGMAVRLADSITMSDRENALTLQVALVSFAVIAVDGDPLWKVFNVELQEGERVFVEGTWRPIFNPMKPPTRVRSIAAAQFMDFLNLEATSELVTALWDAYNSRVDSKGQLKDFLEKGGQQSEEEAVPLP